MYPYLGDIKMLNKNELIDAIELYLDHCQINLKNGHYVKAGFWCGNASGLISACIALNFQNENYYDDYLNKIDVFLFKLNSVE